MATSARRRPGWRGRSGGRRRQWVLAGWLRGGLACEQHNVQRRGGAAAPIHSLRTAPPRVVNLRLPRRMRVVALRRRAQLSEAEKAEGILVSAAAAGCAVREQPRNGAYIHTSPLAH